MIWDTISSPLTKRLYPAVNVPDSLSGENGSLRTKFAGFGMKNTGVNL